MVMNDGVSDVVVDWFIETVDNGWFLIMFKSWWLMVVDSWWVIDGWYWVEMVQIKLIMIDAD